MRRFDVLRGSRAVDYVIAVVAATTAAGVRLLLTPFFGDRNQLVMFYPAIMVSAWLGGFWPGLVATVVSAGLDGYFFLEPVFTLRLPHHGDKLALAIFIATGAVTANSRCGREAMPSASTSGATPTFRCTSASSW
jgi:K+-sensing histidine kinase KdpD